MPVHHLAIVTTDLEASHRFYTEAMGFTLAKVEVGLGTGKKLFDKRSDIRERDLDRDMSRTLHRAMRD